MPTDKRTKVDAAAQKALKAFFKKATAQRKRRMAKLTPDRAQLAVEDVRVWLADNIGKMDADQLDALNIDCQGIIELIEEKE